jgi:hypothetical protein
VSVSTKSAPAEQQVNPTTVRSQQKVHTSSTEFNLFDVDLAADYYRAPYSTISMFDCEVEMNESYNE